MLRSLIQCGVLAGALVLGACELEVINPNDPETERVLANPTDVEGLAATTYLRWHSAMYGSINSVWGMASSMSFENSASNANEGIGVRGGLPRGANDNTIGHVYSSNHRRVYYIAHESARTTSLVLKALDQPGFSIGPIGTTARNNRARAFAEFVRGLSLGYVALTHDSGAVVTPALDTKDPGELVSYKELMTAALDALQLAIDAANAPATGPDGFPIPTLWLPTPPATSKDDFVRLVRSYRARLRAGVARTPTERAAVDWNAVIADAQNGITADHINVTTTTNGPFNAWARQFMSFGGWHQMTPFVIGMADVSGSYASWIAAPLDARGGVGTTPLIVTPDLRFPQGATRTEQQNDLKIPCAVLPCKRYFRNRPDGEDTYAGPSWSWSNYDHIRNYDWGLTKGQRGNFPFFTLAELDMLQAEGHIRRGNFSAAAALINKTRTKNGLPAITAFDATSPVPGGANCVPRVPTGSTVACGNMMEAMKYEKRIETAYMHYMAWYVDMRGWGDLVEGTPLDWPVPYEDMLARGRDRAAAQYLIGGLGLGNPHTAAKGTYGW